MTGHEPFRNNQTQEGFGPARHGGGRHGGSGGGYPFGGHSGGFGGSRYSSYSPPLYSTNPWNNLYPAVFEHSYTQDRASVLQSLLLVELTLVGLGILYYTI